jgi:hypothetical protein
MYPLEINCLAPNNEIVKPVVIQRAAGVFILRRNFVCIGVINATASYFCAARVGN